MPKVAPNADQYAAARQGIFFPAHNQTPVEGNLTGQCVTLVKWFLAEMTEVPNPFAARGDARYVGKNLVSEGHAIEVPYDQRQEGDIACYEFGIYGHIGTILSGDRIFEENVNVAGAARKLVDGAYVYASRIGSLNERWRPVRPNIYRIKSYGGSMAELPIVKGDVDNLVGELWGRNPKPEDYGFTKGNWHDFVYGLVSAYPYKDRMKDYADAVEKRAAFNNALAIAEQRGANFQRICDTIGVDRQSDEQATTDAIINKLKSASDSIEELKRQIAELSERPTNEEVQALKYKAEALEAEKVKDTQTGNAFIRWIGNLFNGGR